MTFRKVSLTSLIEIIRMIKFYDLSPKIVIIKSCNLRIMTGKALFIILLIRNIKYNKNLVKDK